MLIIKDNQILNFSEYSGTLDLYEKYNISCSCLLDYYLNRIKKEEPYTEIKKYEDLEVKTRNKVDVLFKKNPKLLAIHRENQLSKLLCKH
jgi:hypothetical protein